MSTRRLQATRRRHLPRWLPAILPWLADLALLAVLAGWFAFVFLAAFVWP